MNTIGIWNSHNQSGIVIGYLTNRYKLVTSYTMVLYADGFRDSRRYSGK